MQPDMKPGDVWLVGAGPGDAELLTLKAARLIAAADIIFYDALVGPDIIALARTDAQCVNVGKRSGRHSMPQTVICDCLLEAAESGLRVMRLKGGDPGIFGRATEEISFLQAHDISVHIVPGVTAACAAAASAGLSLTRRGEVRQLRMITAHARDDETLALDWTSLADPTSVLAIYMGKCSAAEIAAQLMTAGLPADHPVVAVENVSLPREKHVFCALSSLAQNNDIAEMAGPVLLLIGVSPVAQPEFAFSQGVARHS
jgi:uroporphyrin-III C-methyltransferase